MHHCYHTPTNTDLGAFRAKAEDRYRRLGELTVIHQHPHNEPCESGCKTITDHVHTEACVPGCDLKSGWRDPSPDEMSYERDQRDYEVPTGLMPRNEGMNLGGIV